MSAENGTPRGLPVLVTGWGAGQIRFVAGEDFWRDADRFAGEGSLGEQLDAALAGRSAPRTWVILHEPGEWELAAATALSLGRALSERDQAVILLDGDPSRPHFTRFAGRLESLGWSDMLRYGSGLTECGARLPFSGRQGYFLGVGTFAEPEPQGAAWQDLLRRLRRQADDVLICAPADAIGRSWSAWADLRLLCWDRAQRAGGLVDDLAGNLESAGTPLTHLVGFGLPGAAATADEDQADEDQAVEDQAPRVEAEKDEAPKNPVIEDREMEDMVDEVLVDPAADDEAAPRSASEILDQLEAEDGLSQPGFSDDPGGLDERDDLADVEFARRKGNSRLFVWLAVVAVLLITVSGFYYVKYLRVPPGGLFPETAGTSDESGLPSRSDQQDGNVIHENGLATMAQKPDEVAVRAGDPIEIRDSSDQEGLIDAAQTADEAPVADQVLEPVEAAPEPQESRPSVAPVFDMGPFTHPAGEEGWALHVYSFPDSNQALAMQKDLAGRGFRSAIRAVEIEDRGRWYRVYLGSFPDRDTAGGAREALLEKLGEDWARVVHFR